MVGQDERRSRGESIDAGGKRPSAIGINVRHPARQERSGARLSRHGVERKSQIDAGAIRQLKRRTRELPGRVVLVVGVKLIVI